MWPNLETRNQSRRHPHPQTPGARRQRPEDAAPGWRFGNGNLHHSPLCVRSMRSSTSHARNGIVSVSLVKKCVMRKQASPRISTSLREKSNMIANTERTRDGQELRAYPKTRFRLFSIPPMFERTRRRQRVFG